MEKERLNSSICNSPKDDYRALRIGFRSSFPYENDSKKSQDTDSESLSSDSDIPNLREEMSRGGSITTEAGSMPVSISGSDNEPLGIAPDAAENGMKNRENKEMLTPMMSNIQIQQFFPRPPHCPKLNPTPQGTPQPYSHMSRGGSTTSEAKSMPSSISGSDNEQLGCTPDSAVNGMQNREYKQMPKPMMSNIQIQQFFPHPPQCPNLNPQGTYQPYSLMSGGWYTTAEAGSMPSSISGSDNEQLSSAPEASENGMQNREYKWTQTPMMSNIQIQKSFPQAPYWPNLNPSPQGTHQPYSHRAQNHKTHASNHEQPRLHHQQQHGKLCSVQQNLRQVAPQHQQPGPEQTLRFPVPMVPQHAPVYQQQVQAWPYPQPPVYQLIPQTQQYNQAPIQQPILIVPPHMQVVHQQQYPHWESSCLDSQSESSVGSTYPSVVSIPGYPGSYNDHNLRNQLTVRPLSTQCNPSSQVINRGLFHSQGAPAFSYNAQGCSIPSNMKCSNNQMTVTVPSSIPGQPRLNLETNSSDRNINITPTKETSMNSPQNLRREDDIYTENFSYVEEKHGRHSNLYVNWSGNSDQLKNELERKSLEVHCIRITPIKGLWNVVFDSHPSARKAFNTQRDIKIRMVPPRNSKRHWFRNPGSNFLVKYETNCRLAIRARKAVTSDLVGELLMSGSKSEEQKGCFIWADRLKGHRIRIVGCVGKFMFPSERVIDMEEIPSDVGNNEPIGWVSYRGRYTREVFAVRTTGNILQDYIYDG